MLEADTLAFNLPLHGINFRPRSLSSSSPLFVHRQLASFGVQVPPDSALVDRVENDTDLNVSHCGNACAPVGNVSLSTIQSDLRASSSSASRKLTLLESFVRSDYLASPDSPLLGTPGILDQVCFD
jgi:hypothetical protein